MSPSTAVYWPGERPHQQHQTGGQVSEAGLRDRAGRPLRPARDGHRRLPKSGVSLNLQGRKKHLDVQLYCWVFFYTIQQIFLS